MKRLLVPALMISLTMSIVVPASANHSWKTYHWARTQNPFTLTVVDSVIGEWDSYIGAVVSDWSASSVIDLAAAAGDTGDRSRASCSPIAGKIRVCNASYGGTGWLGLASVWLSGDHITQATTKVNDSYFVSTSYNNPSAKRHVLCQEVGHAFGLAHQYAEPTCMNDMVGLSDPAYTRPSPHDYSHLLTIYDHADASVPVSSPKKGPKGNRHGHQHTSMIRSTDDGQTLLTFIVWA